MAIDVDWGGTDANPYRIYVPKADTTLVQASPEIRSLDVNAFRNELKSLEAGAEGMPWPDTHAHNGEVTLSGITYARFVEILDPYVIEFEDGQYTVQTPGANHNVADVTIQNQVSLIVQNSAGLLNLDAILQEFESEVYFDATASNPGTSQDDGTRVNPVSTVDAALTLVDSKGKSGVVIVEGAFVLDRDVDNLLFIGSADPDTSTMDFNGFDATRCRFDHCTVTGDANGNRLVLTGCIMDALTNVHGLFERCYLRDHSLDAGAGLVTYDNCRSNVPGTVAPVVDANGRAGDIENRAYAGGFELSNLTSASCDVSADLMSGHLILAASCTDASSLVLRGTGKITNNSGISLAKIDTSGFVDPVVVDGFPIEEALRVMLSVAAGRFEVVTQPGGKRRFIFYRQDGVTESHRGDVDTSERDTVSINGDP